ncbi:hypothetical protein ONZ45_g10236 [Pleurotus djamor]|nr:hypothetical protein ONZ45_g10236 [Pleurotus djamor]
MVFGLIFSRKPSIPQLAETQLRTPSPSVQLDEPQSLPQASEVSPTPDLVTVTDSADLYRLIRSVPAQTLWTYTLKRLHPTNELATPIALTSSAIPEEPVPPHILTALTDFFASLTPPPTLHCVRCHKFYMEVDNNDRSCRVAHDDDSAEIDGYETLYNCCGKTVEGTGDMGPPDGWCYEGMHTTDSKRARFRADSTPHNDKLDSCNALRCHEPVTSSPRSTRSTKSRKARTGSPSKASAAPSSPRAKRRRTDADDLPDDVDTSSLKGKGKDVSDEPEGTRRGRSTARKRPRKSEPQHEETADRGTTLERQDTEVLAKNDAGPATRTRSRSRSRGPTKPASSLATLVAASKTGLETSPSATPKSKRPTKPMSKAGGSAKPASRATKPASSITVHKRGSSVFSAATDHEEPPSSSRGQTPISLASSSPASHLKSNAPKKNDGLHRRASSSLSMVVEIPVSRNGSFSPSRPLASVPGKTSSFRSGECPQGSPKSHRLGVKRLGEVVASSVDGEETLLASAFR